MKRIYYIKGLLTAILLVCTSASWAYNFSAVNDDGKTVYYNILSSSDRTCEVTCYSTSSSSNNSAYTGSIEIPTYVKFNNVTYTVTRVGELAFRYCSQLKDVTIGNSVTEIGGSAFYNCTRLTKVTIGNSVTSIGESAFYNCSWLEEVTIGNSLTTIGNGAFQWCSTLSEIVLPNSMTTIGDYAFRYSAITKINIPSGVTQIGEQAFFNCTELTSIKIPSSVTYLGEYAFAICISATEIEVSEDNECYCSKDGVLYSKDMTTLIQFPLSSPTLSAFAIPNSVTRILGYAFQWSPILEEVVIPSSVTEIGSDAFFGCTGLTEITIPESVTKIGDYAFYGCTGLMQVTIGSGVTEIGDYAFGYCLGLKTVSFNAEKCKSVTSVSWSPFSECESLSTVNIGKEVTFIPSYLFSGCTSLTKINWGENVSTIEDYTFNNTGIFSITIPNSVTQIGTSAFDSCDYLTEVTIGNSVSSIGSYAFAYCFGLSKVNSLNTEPPTCSSSSFQLVDVSTCSLSVPEGSKEAYSTTDVWKDFLSIVEIDVSPVADIPVGGNAEPAGYYTTDGKIVPTLQRGINIIRYSDGTARKVLVK